jgi:hypothetical protein
MAASSSLLGSTFLSKSSQSHLEEKPVKEAMYIIWKIVAGEVTVQSRCTVALVYFYFYY